ncbi:MAG: hypothetical protein IJU81_05400 [Bacteroidales bacterium]|nr:hypothetical protein [Bacteroidales bacterium]
MTDLGSSTLDGTLKKGGGDSFVKKVFAAFGGAGGFLPLQGCFYYLQGCFYYLQGYFYYLQGYFYYLQGYFY